MKKEKMSNWEIIERARQSRLWFTDVILPTGIIAFSVIGAGLNYAKEIKEKKRMKKVEQLKKELRNLNITITEEF